MHFTALIISFLLSASEAGPLRLSANDRLDRRSQPRSPRLWPRESFLNGTGQSFSPVSTASPTTTATPEGSSGTSAAGGRTTVVTVALASLLGSHNATARPTQTSTSTSISEPTDPTSSAQSSQHPASDAPPTETPDTGGSSRGIPSPFMSSGVLISPSGTATSSQATTKFSSSASPTHGAATGSPNTGVPTAIATAPQASGTVSPETYQRNLVSAQKYNALFATLNERSACSPNQAACVGGSVAKCGSDGSFTTVSTCIGGTLCYAIPLNTTQGVTLACVDTSSAKSILGSLLPEPPAESSEGSSASKSSPSSSQGPASAEALQTTTVTQTVPGTTITVNITPMLPASSSSASATTTSTTFITKSTILTVIPVQAPSPSPHSPSGAAADTPVTVFVTVTQTEKEVLTSIVTTTATVVVRE